MTTISIEAPMVDLRPLMSEGLEPWMNPRPPAPPRVDMLLTQREAHTLRMLMDGYESRGLDCQSGAAALRYLLREVRNVYDRAAQT